jgi:hypothetical protein
VSWFRQGSGIMDSRVLAFCRYGFLRAVEIFRAQRARAPHIGMLNLSMMRRCLRSSLFDSARYSRPWLRASRWPRQAHLLMQITTPNMNPTYQLVKKFTYRKYKPRLASLVFIQPTLPSIHKDSVAMENLQSRNKPHPLLNLSMI